MPESLWVARVAGQQHCRLRAGSAMSGEQVSCSGSEAWEIGLTLAGGCTPELEPCGPVDAVL